MNWDRLEGNWKKMKGRVRQKWGELTDDDLEKAAGRRKELVGVIQKRYGKAKEQIEREVDQWIAKLDGSDSKEDSGNGKKAGTSSAEKTAKSAMKSSAGGAKKPSAGTSSPAAKKTSPARKAPAAKKTSTGRVRAPASR